MKVVVPAMLLVGAAHAQSVPAKIEDYPCGTKEPNAWPVDSWTYITNKDCAQNPWKCAIDNLPYNNAATGLIKMITRKSPAQCAAECEAHLTCIAALHDTSGGTCFLHSSLAQWPLQYEMYTLASPPYSRFSVTRICKSVPAKIEDYPCNTEQPNAWPVDSLTYITNKDCAQNPWWCAINNLPYNNAATGLIKVITGKSLASCLVECEAYLTCIAALYDISRGTCFLHSSLAQWPLQYEPYTLVSPPFSRFSVTRICKSVPAKIEDYACNTEQPNAWPVDSLTYITNDNCAQNPWKCAINNLPYNNAATGLIKAITQKSLASCLVECEAYLTCIAALYDISSGTCFLHSSLAQWPLQYEPYTLVSPPFSRFSVTRICKSVPAKIEDYRCNTEQPNAWPLDSLTYITNKDCAQNPWWCALNNLPYNNAATGLIKVITRKSLVSCLTECAADLTCIAALYDISRGTCFLHSSLAQWPLQYEPYTLASPPFSRFSVTRICKSVPAKIEDYPCNTEEPNAWPVDSLTYITNNDCAQNPWWCALNNLPYDNAATGLIKVLTRKTLASCFVECQADLTCIAALYDISRGTCFLHSSLAQWPLQYEPYTLASPAFSRFSVTRICRQ